MLGALQPEVSPKSMLILSIATTQGQKGARKGFLF